MKTKIKEALKNGIIIRNSWVPRMLSWVISIRAITIYPFIIYRDEPDERSVNHERIHIRQQKELLVLPFYILYVYFWLVNRLWHRDSGPNAYYNIPFEMEAYCNDENMLYLMARPRHAWKHYCPPRVH